MAYTTAKDRNRNLISREIFSHKVLQSHNFECHTRVSNGLHQLSLVGPDKKKRS